MPHRKRWYLWGIIILLLCSCQAWEDRQTVASVNDEVIKKRPYRLIYQARYQQLLSAHFQKIEGIEQKLGKAIVEEMINDLLFLQEARKRDLVPSLDMVKKSMGHMKDGGSIDPMFEKAMKEKGMSLEEIQQEMQTRMAVGALRQQLIKDIQTTEKEAQEFYQKNKAIFVEPAQSQIRLLFALDDARAQNYQELIRLKRNSFEELTKNNPPQLASMLRDKPEWVDAEAYWPEMKKTLLETKVGTVGGPVKAQGMEGFYLVKVYAKKAPRTRSFIEVRDELIVNLNRDKVQAALNAWLAEQRQKAKIEINESRLAVKVDTKPSAPPKAAMPPKAAPQSKGMMPPAGGSALPKGMMPAAPSHPPIGKSKS